MLPVEVGVLYGNCNHESTNEEHAGGLQVEDTHLDSD